MALIELIKVGKSEYKDNDSLYTVKKQISKMMLYHSADLTWMQLKPYIAQQNSFIIANVDGLSQSKLRAVRLQPRVTLCETAGRKVSERDCERQSVGTYHNHQRI
jgi:hypothetical protein